MASYYKSEFDLIKHSEKNPAKIQVIDSNNRTKWLNLNKESAADLVDWLIKNELI